MHTRLIVQGVGARVGRCGEAEEAGVPKKDFEQALKDGFLAIDRAILSGTHCTVTGGTLSWLTNEPRQTRNTRRKYRGALPPSAS